MSLLMNLFYNLCPGWDKGHKPGAPLRSRNFKKDGCATGKSGSNAEKDGKTWNKIDFGIFRDMMLGGDMYEDWLNRVVRFRENHSF